jgi:hypothetical protein
MADYQIEYAEDVRIECVRMWLGLRAYAERMVAFAKGEGSAIALLKEGITMSDELIPCFDR